MGIMAIATVNPATGETVQTYAEMSEADVDRCLAAAARADRAGLALSHGVDRARHLARLRQVEVLIQHASCALVALVAISGLHRDPGQLIG